jgi:uncharacterized sulfatase
MNCRLALALSVLSLGTGDVLAAERPNVLWITCEDTGPQLGCYGDAYSVSPNIDALAAKGCRYLHCWSNAPVCAPARTTIITGMYPTSLGAEHMRSEVKLPEHIRLYPQYLRDAGYYCTNNSKTDYNVIPVGKVWDESSNKAHWKNRPEGQPFFAIFNHTISHESQIRNKIDDKDRIHDPAKVRVPAYHPDVPEVRKDWAQYYDRITMMDKLVGQNLQELAAAGLAEETIVFFYGDHGSGMPRSKRMPYNSGLHVPLVVYFPEKWRHLATEDCKQGGGASERLVSFVDLAPTLLSLCGVEIPAHMQGHAFLGPKATEPQPFLYGFRGRMDERIDMMRSVTDGRYVYIRNFMPHRPYGQHVDYMFQTPTTRVWHELWKAGKCNAAQSHFWEPKPVEELYDLESDRDEVINLVGELQNEEVRARLSRSLHEQMGAIRDIGFIPEAEIHRLSQNHSPAELGTQLAHTSVEGLFTDRGAPGTAVDAGLFLAWHAGDQNRNNRSTSPSKWVAIAALQLPREDHQLNVFWSLTAVLGSQGYDIESYRAQLQGFLQDHSASVRIVAAEALGRYGNDADLALALPVLLEYANAEKHGVYNAVAALNAIDYLDEKAASIKDQVAQLPKKDPNAPDRTASYCDRLIAKILADLE